MKMKGNLISLISVIFILSAIMAMTGCSTIHKVGVLNADVGIIEGIAKKIPLKAALYVPDATKAYSCIAPIPLGAWEYNFGEYITQASFTAFVQVFEEIAVVKGRYNLEGFDVVIEPEFVKEKTRVDISFSKTDSTVGVDYRVSDRDGVFWKNVFVGNSTTGGKISEQGADGIALSKAVEQAALQMWADFNNKTIINKLYAKRISPSKPMLEEKIEAFSKAPVIKSDIDELPAIISEPRKNAYAVVIGIENYRSLPKSDYSGKDAALVKSYLKVLGYPERNIDVITDEKATRTDIEKSLEAWLPNRAKKDSTVIVYFSGHGAPEPSTGEAYIVPYDGDPNYLSVTGYPLKRLYERLGKLEAKEIIVVLDSCFSGAGGRSVLAKGARPLVMMAATGGLSSKMAVLTATQGSQIS
ncbi:MAG: caspase family protein, partial [Deltaproteobacteria bacterium]|nr:caspase family protein [Deltaproteobacteria bacterium]